MHKRNRYFETKHLYGEAKELIQTTAFVLDGVAKEDPYLVSALMTLALDASEGGEEKLLAIGKESFLEIMNYYNSDLSEKEKAKAEERAGVSKIEDIQKLYQSVNS